MTVRTFVILSHAVGRNLKPSLKAQVRKQKHELLRTEYRAAMFTCFMVMVTHF